MRIGTSGSKVIDLDLTTLNKHGIIAGSSGSGKTTTIKTIAQQLNNNNIPTLLFDAKGDIKDLLQDNSGMLYTFKGEHGTPLKTSLTRLGIDLLSNILELNTTQQGILITVFLIAQDKGIAITTIPDLEKLFLYIIDNNDSLVIRYGRLSNVSINTIRRKINSLKLNDLDLIFNFDNFNHNEIINNKGINIIDSIELVKYPKLYASIVVMILRQFYDNLNDSLDQQPKAIIFIDESHLLFKDTNKKMIEDIEQITKLIRSKGIGLFFISQSIEDIPNNILNQLTTKIQHQLHLMTTRDFTRARAIANAFTDSKQDINTIIQKIKTLNVGRALIQYESNQNLVNDTIQIDWIHKEKITTTRLTDLSPRNEIKADALIPKTIYQPTERKESHDKDHSTAITLSLLLFMIIIFILIN